MKPRASIEITDDRRLAYERIVDALMVDRWRLLAAEGVVVFHNVFLIGRRDCPGIHHLLIRPALKTIDILHLLDFSGAHFGAVPKHEDRRDAVHRTKDRPILLPGLCKFTLDHIVGPRDHRHLRNRTAAPLQFRRQILREFPEGHRIQAQDLAVRSLKLILDGRGKLPERDRGEDDRGKVTCHASSRISVRQRFARSPVASERSMSATSNPSLPYGWHASNVPSGLTMADVVGEPALA